MAIVKRLLTKVNKGLSGCKHAVGAIVGDNTILKTYQLVFYQANPFRGHLSGTVLWRY